MECVGVNSITANLITCNTAPTSSVLLMIEIDWENQMVDILKQRQLLTVPVICSFSLNAVCSPDVEQYYM